jgi:trehalose 6-phosphate phosphatase
VLEVRPPVRIDKGAGIITLLSDADVDVAVYVGDDSTDVDAFKALGQLVQDGSLKQAIRVGVSSPDGPASVIESSDFVVDGTEGVRELLAALVAD